MTKEETQTEELEEVIEDYFVDKTTFSKQIEQIVMESNGAISFIDAAIAVADYNQIDLEDISSFIMPRVKQRIESEALESRLIHGEKRTKLDAFFA